MAENLKNIAPKEKPAQKQEDLEALRAKEERQLDEIIRERSIEEVIKHIDDFKSLSYLQVVEKIIAKGKDYAREIIKKIDFFDVAMHQEIAEKLAMTTEKGRIAFFAHLDKFKNIDYNRLVDVCLNAENAVPIRFALAKGYLKGLTIASARKIFNLNKNTGGKLNKRIIDMMTKHNDSFDEQATEYIKETDYLREILEDQDITTEEFAEKINTLSLLTDTEIAKFAIDMDKAHIVLKGFNYFTGLDKFIADKLIDLGFAESIVNNFDKYKAYFGNLDPIETVDKIIDVADWRSVADFKALLQNAESFKPLTPNDIVKKILIKHEHVGMKVLSENIKHLHNLDDDIAKNLIKRGFGDQVLEHIKSFDVDHNIIIEMLIHEGEHAFGSAMLHLDAFSDLTMKTLDKMLEMTKHKKNMAVFIAERINFFIDFTPEALKKVGTYLLRENDFERIDAIYEHTDKSKEVKNVIQIFDQQKAISLSFKEEESHPNFFINYFGDKKINELFPRTFAKAREYIFSSIENDVDLADYFLENLEEYHTEPWVEGILKKAVQHYSVAVKFLKTKYHTGILWSQDSWVNEIVDEAKKVAPDWDKENLKSTRRRRKRGGFAEHDPYENHQWLFKGEQVKTASVLADLLAGKDVPNEWLEQNDVMLDKDGKPLLIEHINEKIDTAYQAFLGQVRVNEHIADEEKEILLDPENSAVRMTNLLTTVRSLVARYLVQIGDLQCQETTSNIESILAEGFKKYIQIHEIDVPLYDKLYAEFDNLREAGRNITEVKLGRDGDYAWMGRRAQDVARRRKMGYKKRKELKAKGEMLEIKPKYLVYPRYFRDSINYETKRQFLEQEGISPDADPLFYDTGYTGTIPEQIMKIMDFDDDDIERRIRLLSAQAANRRVRGISENARGDIVEHIEHNAKLEESAEGLIIDEKTGKIRHIAKPTSPQEQFYYMMIKQAIGRHYWIKEHLHHTPTEHTNLDSEHHTLRIRDTYKDILPEGFTTDPQTFLNEHGTFLKGSKGEGDYPDEEILSFTLKNGKEVIAKRTELRKAKEARKELAILIGAQKAGLPTAAPVGFLSGKEDTDHSYMLMEKLEGTSGRNFEKKLRETGDHSEEYIQKIMDQIYYKNRKMADLFREKLGIDKRWRIKDTIINFNEETGEVGNVIPIDWERVEVYDPTSPKEIDGINIV